MEKTATLDKRAVQLTEFPVNQHVTLVQMPDMVTFDLHVYGDYRYLVHFLNPNLFGVEFATIREGYNFFTQKKTDEQTKCYLFDDVELRNIMAGSATVQTPPIIIPPGRSGR